MQEFFSQATVQAVVWTAAGLVLAVIGWYFLKRYRDQHASSNLSNDHLLHFRDLKREGVLDETEFRTIKTVLGRQAQGTGDSPPSEQTSQE